MCLFTAAVTGTFGILQKQYTACMVTGVMYVVAGEYIYTYIHICLNDFCKCYMYMYTGLTYQQGDMQI